MTIMRVAAIAGLSLLWGCAAPTPDDAPVKGPPGVLQGTVPSQRGSSSESELDAEAASAAVETLRGLSLAQALERAEQRHPEIRVALAEIHAAEGRTLQAGLLPNPEAVLRMESAPWEDRTFREAEYVAGVSQSLPLGSRLAAEVEAARHEHERRVQELEARRRELRKRVQGAFATALYLEEVLHLQDGRVQSLEDGVSTARARQKAGDALPEEVARAELELYQNRLERDRVRSLREQALVALAAVMGDPALRVESVEGSLEAALELPAIETLSARLEAHPLLRAAEAEMAERKARVQLAEAERIPDVNLDLFYRRLEHSDKNAFDVGLSIGIPLFSPAKGRLREAEAGVAAARARAESTHQELVRTLKESYFELTRALAAARAVKEEVLPRVETILNAAEARYRGGDISLSEVVWVRRDWTAAHLTYLEALREVMQAWAGLSPFLVEGPDQ